MNSFTKIISLCEKHGFLKSIHYPHLKRREVQINIIGALLQENLRNEWFNNIVINKDISVFMNNGKFNETYNFAKSVCLDLVPFGIAELLDMKGNVGSVEKNVSDNNSIEFRHLFDRSSILRCTIFVAPAESTQFFHQWQRQRKIWWRKISANPSRYFLTDIKSEDNNQIVSIVAKYPWGDQVMETLTLYTSNIPKVTANQLQIKVGKKSAQAHAVISDICFPSMVLNALCDAYEEPSSAEGAARPLLRFHRMLAPYKISFSITPSNQKSILVELKDLALYLCRQLRTNRVSSLFLPSSFSYTLETQWKQYDQMGVPYNVLLNENTLKTGIVLLRSRDTTLKEQVHVTDLSNYVEQLFRNY